ncbi:hypothetical protein [Serratia liquefaciens]|uniref:hypothetical protein n=1 Tax=Serratia liquefaciens TaxID=614 RepID=UPI0039AEB7DE
MDNKLSELSRPVDICNWKMDSWRAAPCNGTEWAKGYFEGWNKYHQKVEGLAPLYSQEYVSALLADRDAWQASALALRDELRVSQAIANECQQLMCHMDAGGDFFKFQRDKNNG